MEEPKTILIIDDEKVILLGISAIMRHAGYNVLTADSGTAGLAVVKEQNLDLIICDINMPPPNGFELRQILSHDPDKTAIPFIFVTARSSQNDKMMGFETGADDYITKPFDRQELLARVNAVLRRNETARKQGREEVKDEMDRLRHEILNNMTHELRTPIGGLLNMLELTMKARFEDPEEQRSYIGRALTNAYHVRGLIEDLLILNLIDNNGMNVFRQPVDVIFDFNNPIKQCFERYVDKGLNLNINMDDGITIYAPKIEFKQAVIHLVDNAFKFASDNSTVDVHLLPNGEGGCILTVFNDGEGISPVLREKVFERFYQISRGDNRQFRGLGVGLTIARAVARSLGGDVQILDSETGCLVKMEIAPGSLDWQTQV
ncbi:MAG: response regulator [Anaerolineae bacterium]|nr:response regulator [Anaerolineae bacterium]